VGLDDFHRTSFGNHAYAKQTGGNNFDGCMRASLGCLASLAYFLLGLLVLVFTLGFGASIARRLFMKAAGWLIDMSQTEYNRVVVDTSTPNEAAFNGGVPVSQPLGI
jgi:hypothetical protein